MGAGGIGAGAGAISARREPRPRAGQFPGELGQDLGAEVVLEEKLDLPTGAGPPAVGVGLDQVPEVPGAAGFRPPRSELAVLVGVAVAGAVDQGGEPLGDTDGVRK